MRPYGDKKTPALAHGVFSPAEGAHPNSRGAGVILRKETGLSSLLVVRLLGSVVQRLVFCAGL